MVVRVQLGEVVFRRLDAFLRLLECLRHHPNRCSAMHFISVASGDEEVHSSGAVQL
ncbi:hypothetical protein CONPUDRAFT_170145, partial [Coniophora puteana RWD-64-598 SS2]